MDSWKYRAKTNKLVKCIDYSREGSTAEDELQLEVVEHYISSEEIVRFV